MVRSQEAQALTIGKLAAAGGVGVETVRFYQRKGLLTTPTRNAGFRVYGPDDVRQLRFIKQAQTAGFTLVEIRELLRLDAGNDHRRVRALATARIEALEAKIAELASARDSLKDLADQCAKGRKGPCPILKSFER